MHAPQALLSRRFRVVRRPFHLVTADGPRIAGTRLGDPAPGRPALALFGGGFDRAEDGLIPELADITRRLHDDLGMPWPG